MNILAEPVFTLYLACPMPEDSAPDVVREERDGAVAVITLNRPDRYNAASAALSAALQAALERAGADAAVRAVVVTGAGPGFCAGADLSSFHEGFTPGEGRDFIMQVYGPLIHTLVTLPKPVIAAVNGTAAGVGAAVALACDLRVMADDAALFYAFINLGLGPDGGAGWLLARQVGYSRAFEIAVSGRPVPAERCLALGLCNRVVPAAALHDEALAWAHRLAEGPPVGLALTKAALHHALTHDLMDTLAFEADQQRRAFASEDLREGLAAFRERRPPRFTGR